MGEEVIHMTENGEGSYRCFLSGQKLCLEEVILLYSDALVRFAYSLLRSSAEAEDVAAECISKLFVKTRRFQHASQLRAFLFRCARNRCMDHLRRRGREVPLEDLEHVLGDGDPANTAWKKERDRILYCCMQSLPRQYSAVLQLKYLEDFSQAQIERILGASTKQVYNLLARAKVALKEKLMKEGISYEDI